MLLRGEPGRAGEFAVVWCGFGIQMEVEGGCWSLSMCTMGLMIGTLLLGMKENDGWGVND